MRLDSRRHQSALSVSTAPSNRVCHSANVPSPRILLSSLLSPSSFLLPSRSLPPSHVDLLVRFLDHQRQHHYQ